MPCSSYTLDLSSIEKELTGIDNEIQRQIQKKFEKLMENPFIGETKGYGLKGERVIKVNGQRIVIFYHIDEKKCSVIFDLINEHDKGYRHTF